MIYPSVIDIETASLSLEFQFKMEEELLVHGSPPPEFMIPPPPRPSWLLLEEESCEGGTETCDNFVIMDGSFENSFHSISVIFVCSILLVITLLLASILIYRRRKKEVEYGEERNCHQINDNTMVYNDEEGGGKNLISSALNSIKRNHSTDSSGTCHLDSHFPNSTSLPNHYIQDSERRLRTLDPAVAKEFSNRFPTTVNRVRLSDKPPMVGQSESSSSGDYPHILIGGQPFYLIPSKSSGNPEDGYAYATVDSSFSQQQQPIYEEIDKYYYNNSLCSGISDRGEVGTLHRRDPFENPTRTSYFKPPSTKRSPTNSIYYYSDTLRKPREEAGPSAQKCFRINNKLSDDSDSGISNRSLAPTPKSSDSKNHNNNTVHHTRVLLSSGSKDPKPTDV